MSFEVVSSVRREEARLEPVAVDVILHVVTLVASKRHAIDFEQIVCDFSLSDKQ